MTDNVAPHPKYTCISLCTGAGMLDHGLNAAIGGTLQPILLVERESFAAALLVDQMEKGIMAPAPIWDDVRTITSPECRDFICARLCGKRLDFIIGGIPCQPWSAAGKGHGSADARDLWPATLAAIEVYQPRFVYIENVDGIASKIDGARRILCDLEKAGYTAKAGLFSSKQCGANHLRKRWFFLGIANQRGLEEQGLSIRPSESHETKIDVERSIERMAHNEFKGLERRQTEPRYDGTQCPTAERNSMRLADTETTKSSIGWNSRQWRSRFTNESKELANPEIIRSGESQHQERPITRQSNRRRRPRRDIGGNVVRLADTECKQLSGRRESADLACPPRDIEIDEQERQWRGNAAGNSLGDLPHYAPARNDFAIWDLVAEVDKTRMPAVESSLCGVAHGLADWTHQLRTCGNGVDPLVAAYSFVTLWACLNY